MFGEFAEEILKLEAAVAKAHEEHDKEVRRLQKRIGATEDDGTKDSLMGQLDSREQDFQSTLRELKKKQEEAQIKMEDLARPRQLSTMNPVPDNLEEQLRSMYSTQGERLPLAVSPPLRQESPLMCAIHPAEESVTYERMPITQLWSHGSWAGQTVSPQITKERGKEDIEDATKGNVHAPRTHGDGTSQDTPTYGGDPRPEVFLKWQTDLRAFLLTIDKQHKIVEAQRCLIDNARLWFIRLPENEKRFQHLHEFIEKVQSEFVRWAPSRADGPNRAGDLPPIYNGDRSPEVFCKWQSDLRSYLYKCGHLDEQAKIMKAQNCLQGSARVWFDHLPEIEKRFKFLYEFNRKLQSEFVELVTMIDVSDKTNYLGFLGLMQTNLIGTCDAMFWAFASSVVFATFFFAAWVWPAFEILCDILGWIMFNFGGYNMRSSVTGEPMKLSLVTSSTPEMHCTYLSKLTTREHMKNVLADLESSDKFSFTLAEFFIHLCALVYERNEVVQDILKNWGSDYEFRRFGHDGCCILAIWSVEKNFVVLTFKGTSPLDMSEWLTNCSLRKTPAKNAVLPGLVHTGFYSTLGLPDEDVVRHRQPPVVADCHEQRARRARKEPFRYLEFNFKHHERKNFWISGMLPNILAILSRFPAKQKPNLWVTGHSLGGATASLMTAMMLWGRSQIGATSPVVNVKWDEEFVLRGTYTFGTPRTGDTDYRDAIETVLRDKDVMYSTSGQPKYQFYRVINANDPVCSVPGGPLSVLGTFFRKKKADPFLDPTTGRYKTRPPGVTLIDFQHIGQPIRIDFRLGGKWNEDRSMLVMMYTFFVELLLAIPDAFIAPTMAAKFMALPIHPFWLVRDHFPSEYIKNLEAARKRNADVVE